MDERNVSRRRLLQRLGLAMGAAYVAPLVLSISSAKAGSEPSAPSQPSAPSSPSEPSAPSVPSEPSAPSEASGPSEPIETASVSTGQVCTDAFGNVVPCSLNPQ